MLRLKSRLLPVLLASLLAGGTATSSVEAGVIPWTYNAIFGYGPIFPQRHGLPPGYISGPVTGPMQPWGGYATTGTAGYGGWGSPAPQVVGYTPYSSGFSSAPVTSYYGPSYFSGSVLGGDCGCNPCAVNCCDPCGNGCATGDCSVSGSASTYSPEPSSSDSEGEVVPTFKPTPQREKSPNDPNDEFVPIERRERDYPPPRSSIPDGSTPDSSRSTAPNVIDLLPEDEPVIPMSPIERPMNPAGGFGTEPGTSAPNGRSTIPGAGSSPARPAADEEDVLPGGSLFRSEPANPNPGTARPLPDANDSSTPFFPRPSAPAPIEPQQDEPVLPGSSATPLEVPSAPVASVSVPRQRLSLKAGYRNLRVERPEIPAEPVLEAGTSKLAIR